MISFTFTGRILAKKKKKNTSHHFSVIYVGGISIYAYIYIYNEVKF